ncbi:MAG TPA: hypothetical protein VFN96_05305 [Gemmatimonadales bacterium]|nr:hypothetical protein [Gemmatimonadales bacterium]
MTCSAGAIQTGSLATVSRLRPIQPPGIERVGSREETTAATAPVAMEGMSSSLRGVDEPVEQLNQGHRR